MQKQFIVPQRKCSYQKVALIVPLVLCHYGLLVNSFQFSAQPLSSLIPPLAKSIPNAPGVGLTSGLISKIAVAGLKRRLKCQTSVTCDVTTSSATNLLIRGEVGPVTVRGRGWQTGGGLSCRAIEATLEGCEVDTAQVLSRRKIRLKTPAQGRAMIALNEVDFSNFITHPLMSPPTMNEAITDENKSLKFLKDEVNINPQTQEVAFTIMYLNRKWKCQMRRGSTSENRAIIQVMPMVEDTNDDGDEINTHVVSSKLAESLSRFFNQMLLELDGTFLTFHDMMITDKGVMLSLSIRATKFPSRSLVF